jgi:hypothetical protein
MPRTKAIIGGLYANYDPDCWYFELIELLRKVVLTSLLVFIAPDTPLQSAMGVLFAVFFLILYAYAAPYVHTVSV